MKHIILISITAILLFVSCKKDNDDPVDQDAVRVATEATYFHNGNLKSLIRYNYYPDGMIKSEVSMYISDSLSVDTANVYRECKDYSKTDNNHIMVIAYSIINGIPTQKDTSVLKLNSEGLYSQKTGSWHKNADSTWYSLQKYYYDDGYKTLTYSVGYYNDSLEDHYVIRRNTVYTIENGNCVMEATDRESPTIYEYYTDKVNTLNYGKSFYGKINKNPLSKSGDKYYNYEYWEGKISKLSYELNKNTLKSTERDSLPITTEKPPITYFTYLEFPF